METLKSELRPAENWSDKAIVQCRELLGNEGMTKIFFEIKAKRGNCYFGHIRTETSSKALFDISHALKQIDEAVDVDMETGN